MENLCPCHSNKKYQECCKPYHEGKPPETPLLLMRSRYSAYALGLSDYIMKTTHPDNKSFSRQKEDWKKKIVKFSTSTLFEGLEIKDFSENGHMAFVTFEAYLKEAKKDVSFRERSRFLKIDNQWLYESGTVEPL